MSRYGPLIETIQAITAEAKVVALGKKKLKHIKIGGRRYFVTDYTPLRVKDEFGPIKDKDHARVIKTGHKIMFLWVHNTDDNTVTTWRVSDGDEKSHDSASSMQHHIRALEKMGALNRVNRSEQRQVEREMEKRADASLKAMSQWIEKNKKDIEKRLDGLLYDRVKNLVEPEFKKALTDIENGVTPIGFKPYSDTKPGEKAWVRQAASFVLGKIWRRHMDYKVVEPWARKNGVDFKHMDPQDSHFAIDDLFYTVAERLLPARA
jgi:hypothetical protein